MQAELTGRPSHPAVQPRRAARTSPLRDMLTQPAGLVGTSIVTVVGLGAILAPALVAYDPTLQVLLDALLPPSREHLLGTDEFGRDVLSRVVYGARASLLVGLLAIVASSILGTLIGLVAGYRGGRVDEVMMRIMDALLSFPALMLALVINTILGTSLTNAIIAIAVVTLPGFARLARGSTLSTREREFVQAARALGAGDGRILAVHILPNILAPLIVNASTQVSAAIVTEGSLSFLGLGVQPPTPSWGSMLRTGYGYMDSSPWLAWAPGLALMVTVLGFNFLGDALQDALDPRLRRLRSSK
jgi:ABC-type dipeptide/oligopeptide/nickel transport system permease subunit